MGPRSDLDAAFRGGRCVDGDGQTLEVRVVELGALDVDGIAVCDPLAGEPAAVAEHAVTARGCPVELAVVRTTGSGDERVAAARLRLGDRPVAGGTSSSTTVPVDAGTAGFVSPAGATLDEAARDRLEQELARSYRDTWSAARLELGGAQVAAFSSGLGDGVYDVYWGVDAGGAPVALAIDFELLCEPVCEVFVVPRPARSGPVAHVELAERGVTLRRPWLFPRWLEVSSRGLPRGSYVFMRWRRPGDRVLRFPRHHGRPGGFRVDLSELPEDAELVVKLATGRSAPLAIGP